MWWHADAYRLMGIEPVTDSTLSANIEAVERRLGRQLPAAVREWFTTMGAASWLADRRGNFMVSGRRGHGRYTAGSSHSRRKCVAKFKHSSVPSTDRALTRLARSMEARAARSRGGVVDAGLGCSV